MHIHGLKVYGNPIYYRNRDDHKKLATTIRDIEDLTFSEFAEYVINGKPITKICERDEVACPKENKKCK